MPGDISEVKKQQSFSVGFPTYISAKSWFTQNVESSLISFGEWTAGSHSNTCRFNLGNAIRD